MSILPPLEKRRIRVSTPPLSSGNLTNLAAAHPFIQQVDVVYPSSGALDAALSGLETHYFRVKATITDVLSRISQVGTSLGGSSDAWCIDPRGVLTLNVCKETYEALGLTGQGLPFKGHQDRHVIRIALNAKHADSSSATALAKQKTRLQNWEDRRKTQDGVDGWEVAYCSLDTDLGISGAQTRGVTCTKKELNNVHIPVPTITPRPKTRHGGGKKNNSDEAVEELEDWTEAMMELYEWIGMATLGAQRLQANDRVNPFVAVYEPPQPSQIGDVTHLSWGGLLSPEFVQSIIDAACTTIGASAPDAPSFVSITFHGCPCSPVGYLSVVKPDETSAKGPSDPVRLPRASSEDTTSLLILRDPAGELSWSLLECVGQWDTRWG